MSRRGKWHGFLKRYLIVTSMLVIVASILLALWSYTYVPFASDTKAVEFNLASNKAQRDERADLARLRELEALALARNGAAMLALELELTDQRRALKRDEKIKAATEQFKLTPFSYNRPRALNYGKANKLILSIGSANALMSQQRAASGSGPVKSSEANLGGRVRASLDGPSQLVDIQLENQSEGGSAVKDLSSAANATYTWYVTPKTLDKVTLTLTIFNNVVIDGQEVELEGPAYVDTFTINASLWERWKDSLTSVWGIILGIGGLAGLVTAAIELLKWQRERIASRKIMSQPHGNQLPEPSSMNPSVKRRTTVKKKQNQTDSK
jgi:hypothetical protein